MEYTVFIPSYKRAGEVSTLELFPEAILVVIQSQEEFYRKAYPEAKIMVAPEDTLGMAKVRNFILKNSPTEYMIMVDDDIKSIGTYKNAKRVKLTKEQIDRMIITGFTMMEDSNTVLWGLNQNTDRRCYDEYRPFTFSSVILGVFMGIKRTKGIYFDERLPLKEDYDYSIQVLNKYRKIFRFSMYHYEALHLTNEGGCTTHRTYEKEVEQLEIFRKKWGKRIIQYDITKSLNPVVKVPIKGV